MKVIVRLDEQNYHNSESGLVKPLILETEAGSELINSPENMFPYPGKIWVYGGYNTLMQKFDSYSLFRITVEENFQPDDPRNATHCRKVTNGRSAEHLSFEYMDIVEHPFSLDTRQLSDIKFKPTQNIFIRDSVLGYLYGPFVTELERTTFGSYSVRIKGFPTAPLIKNPISWAVPKFRLSEIPQHLLLDLEDNVLGKRQFLTSFHELNNNTKYELVDYIDNNSLIKWFYDNVPKDTPGRLTKEQIKSFKELIQNMDECPQPYYDERKQRIIKLLEYPQEIDYLSLRTETIQKYVSSPEGQEYLSKYVEENADILLEKQLQELNEKALKKHQEFITKLEEDVKNYNLRISVKMEELSRVNKELDKTKQEIERKQLEVSTQRLEILKNELVEYETRLHAIKENLSKYQKLEDIDEEIRKLIEEKKHWDFIIQQLKSETDTLNTKYKSDLVGIKHMADTYYDFLFTQNSVSTDSNELAISTTIRKDVPSASEYIDEIYSFFLNQGREISKDVLVNYLISINQGYITIFAGVPGVGKTSTVQLLSKAVGINDRFLEIAVARGWTSKRDLIGFYNSLNQRFEPSATGMYQVIKTLSDESGDYINVPPYWVLLDEANLSSVEHYWSDFLNISDKHSGKLRLGQEEHDLTDGLRFLATINYDNTTESLSRRLLDRANVILLDPPSIYENISLPKEEVNALILPLTNGNLNEFFGQANEMEFSTSERRILNEILKILVDEQKGGLPLVVSPRSLNSIIKYCSVYRKLLPLEQPLRALDFAVCQKILPLIQGYDMEKRLTEISDKIKEELPRATHLLEKIIRTGQQEHGFYQFFC